MRAWHVGALALLLIAALAPAVRAAPVPAAVFPFVFDDTSPEPPQPAELARLHKIDAQLRDLLARSGRYRIVSTAPVAAQARANDLENCTACAVALARKLGAKVAVVAWVQKVSELILNINAEIRSVATGKMLAAGSVDIRGNTDLSWSRGVSYLVANRLLAPDR